MLLEQLNSIYTIVVNLLGLMICLFMYVKRPTRSGIYALAYLMANLLSNYYWGIYVVIMNDYPNVSSILSYVGWNAAFLILALFSVSLYRMDKVKFFSPLCLIPIPLNIWQLCLYLQYGGYFNNFWQVSLSTFSVCVCLNNILRYFFRKNKVEGLRKPYIEFAVLYLLTMEYTSWTASCFTFPSDLLDPYLYASILSSLTFILMPLAIGKTFHIGLHRNDTSRAKVHSFFISVYTVIVISSCGGGYLLALWMRNTLTAGIGKVGDADPYSVIAVMLFVVSIVINLFTLIIILFISSEQKTFESRRLLIEKKDAEKSNAAKSEFLANMSHEIRTPINAVLGMNEMILRESLEARDMLPSEREEIIKIFSDICNYSGNIESAGNNLLSIINDILDFSKIEAGKMELVESDYKLSSVLNDVSNMISFKAKSKGIEYIVDVDESLPDGLFGDEVRVRQIIINLLNNAVKYTQKGSVHLSVSEKKSDIDKTTTLVVSVKDTGIGIKKEDIDKIFNKFDRVDMQNNSTVEGTGLGLAITESLLKMMGGDIKVESEYGQGSTFTVSIPQIITSEEAIGNFREKFEKSISELKAPKEKFRADDARILIVDDTVMNLTVAKGLLKSTYINIDTAISGEEAIELTKANCYDMILMDQRMPNMDGVTAMHFIKEDGNNINSSTPVICLTADAVSGAREKYLSEGFEDYLTKPIDSSALINALLKYLPSNKIKPVEASSDKTVTSASKDAGGRGLDSQTDEDNDNILIHKNVGMEYCNNDEEFYNSLLQDYVNDSKERTPLLNNLYASKDWKNYCIHIHSLKSTSKMIGAMKLSSIAAKLEKASDKADEKAVTADHDKMLEIYSAVIDEITNTIEINADKQPENDDGIFEFYPEDI